MGWMGNPRPLHTPWHGVFNSDWCTVSNVEDSGNPEERQWPTGMEWEIGQEEGERKWDKRKMVSLNIWHPVFSLKQNSLWSPVYDWAGLRTDFCSTPRCFLFNLCLLLCKEGVISARHCGNDTQSPRFKVDPASLAEQHPCRVWN